MSLETDIYGLIQPLCSGTLIWMDQSKTLPALPFTAMKISSRRMVNQDHYSDVDSNGVQKVKGDREFTLSLQRYQAYDASSVTELLQSISDKLGLYSVIEKFMAKKIAVYDVGPVQDISALLDKSTIEKRASLDIFMRIKLTQTDTVGVVDKISVASEHTPSPTDTDSGIWTVLIDPTP